MNERDTVTVLLRELDRSVVPRPEFAEALLDRLLVDLEATRVPVQRPARRRLFRPRRRLVLAFALALIGAAIAIVVVTRPQKASALDVIRQARAAFATAAPFEATLRVDLNPDGSRTELPKGATATVEVSYGGANRLRTTLVSEHPLARRANFSPGSFQVFDGKQVGSFDAKRNTFFSFASPQGFEPLEFLSWNGSYPNWEDVCRRGGSKVLPSARIAGREARHIRCRDYRGGFWELWIDRESGLMLKIVGEAGGGDFFLGGLGDLTSPQGGFEVERLRYNPTFRPGTFEVAAPRGAFDYQARLQAAIAKLPPFTAVVHERSRAGTYLDRVWWQSGDAWRRNVVAGHRLFGGPGSFLVQERGRVQSYNARDNSYSNDTFTAATNPVLELLPEDDPRYSPTSCPIVGHDQIAGRQAVHRRCKRYDLWVDATTGIALRKHAPGYELRVRHIDYRPTFPRGTFRFLPPAGSGPAHERASDPYYKTKLTPGKPAPNWTAKKLSGGSFRTSDLHGKPALLLLFPDSCPAGDPVCDVFPSLERVYEQSKNKIAFVWVDLRGSSEQARKIVRHNHLTFPVVIDENANSAKSWNIQGHPYWLLLDSHGRVIEARTKTQTPDQLQQLLAKAK